MVEEPREDDYTRRSEANLPPPGDTRPLPDQTLIALAEKSPLPALEPIGQKVARARSEGYRDTELVQGAVAQELAAVVEKSISGGQDSALLRGFERSLKARGRVGFDSAAIASLLSFLRVAPEGLPSSIYHSIANDIIRLVVSDATLTVETVSSLADIVDDASCDPLVRDYVVQHFDLISLRKEFRQISEEHLLRWISNKGDSIAGAAMLVVEYAIRDGRFTGDLRLVEQAVYTHLSGLDSECKSAALSLGASQEYASVSMQARKIASDPNEPSAVRIAAVHALGKCGDREKDPDLLLSLLGQPGGYFMQKAVDQAIKNLSSAR